MSNTIELDQGCFKHYICVQVFPVELTQLPHIEKLYLNNNKLAVLPPELGELRSLRVLRVDNNMLVSVPGRLLVRISTMQR